MIAFVSGILTEIEADAMIVDVGGVGLSVAVPLSRISPLPPINGPVTLYTHLQIRDDDWSLYGFPDKELLRIFRLLLNVSGVGAKTALAIVDKVGAEHFGSVIAAQDIKPFTAVSGVGKKTAERILLELKDKFKDSAAAAIETDSAYLAEHLNKDVLASLRQLGYSATEARAFALRAEGVLGAGANAEALLREALKIALRS